MYLFLKRVISDITLSLRVPLPVAIALEVISGLQIVHIILKVMTDFAEHKAFFIVDFIRYGLSYIGEISPNSLFGESVNVLMLVWVLFAAYFVLHLIMIVYTIISSRFSKEKGHHRVFSFVSWLYLIHSRIIFFIAHFFFMGLINNYNQCGVEGNSSFYCKIGWFAANIILCAFNIGLAAVKELLLYQILKRKDQYAVKNNLINQIVLIHKGVIILISFLVQDHASRAQVCAIMHLFFTLLTLMVLFMKFPFYNVKILKTSIVINGIILSFCIIAVLQIIGVEKRVLDIMWTCLIPLVIKLLLISFQVLSEQILKGDFKSTEKILFLISLLKHNNFGYIPYSMYGNNVSKESVVANGILVSQKFDVEKLRAFDNKKDYEEKIYLHLVEKLISLYDKNPSSKLLLLTMASISLKKLDNIPRTIVLIKKLESMRLPIPISNSLDAFNQTLKRFQLKGDVEDNEKTLNLLDHFKYKEIASQIQKTMLQEVTRHIEFWEEVKKEHVDVKRVVDISCDIQRSSGQVQKMQETYFRPFTQHFINPLMMYGVYLELVKEYSDDARKLIKQFWSLTRGQARGQGLDVYCEEVGIAMISIEKGNLGAITDTSGSMQTLFQIDKQKLIGQQLTSLLPEFAANYLIKVIRNYAKVPTRKLACTFATLGKILHDGTFFEVEVELKLFPKIDREVKLMVVFRKIAAPKPIIIVATDGTIVEASDTLKNSLNINLKSQYIKMKFQDISPDFERINSAFNQEYSNEEGVEILRSFSSKKFSVVGAGTRHFNSRGTLINNGSRGNILLHHANTSSPMNNNGQRMSLVVKPEKRNHNHQITIFSSGAQDKYTEICDEYIQGGKITILKAGNNVSHSSTMRNEVLYDIQVSPSQLNGEIYKILTLMSREEDKINSFIMFPHKRELLFTKIEETEQSGFADEFSEIDERKPETKFIQQQTKKSQMTMLQSRMVSGISDDTKGSQAKPKESVKTPDLDPFIKAHAPSKRIYAKLQDQERSISSTSSRTMASVKALKTIFQRNRTFLLSYRTTFGMLLIVILMISLGIYNYSLSRKAVQQVETGVSIVNLASLRLSQTMRGWQYATRIWLRYLGLRTGQIGTLKSSIWSFGQMMLEYNRQFAGEMANLSDESLFNEIMAPDIQLWELNETYTTTGGGTDSITATNILANMLVFIGNTTMDLTEPYVRQVSTYLCNNTSNDYLVFSESLISATQRMLDDTLSRNINSLQLILGFEIAAVEILCIVLLISARIVVQLYQKLFRAFVKIDERFTIERLHQVHKMRNLLNEDIEIRGFGVTIIEDSKTKFDFYKEKSKDGKGNFRKVGVFQKRNENLILKRLYIDLSKYIFVSFVFIQIITCIFVVSLTQSLDNFRNSQDVTNQLSVTTKAAYTSSVTISTVYMDMDFRNWTEMKVRNQAPASQITKVINEISLINTDLTSVFSKEGEGITDAFIADIFEGTICKYLSQDETTQGYCVTATNYGELGLLAMNSKLLAAENYYVTKYLATPTWQTAYDILDGYVAQMRPVAETLEAVYELVNSHIIDNFEQTTSDFLTQIGILHLGILIAILISAVVVQTVTIKRIRFLDTCRGNVLNTLSYKMLVEDKAIGFYLSRNFVNAEAAISRTM